MVKASQKDFELSHHFTLLIYPFLHTVTGKKRDSRLAALSTQWSPWWERLNDGQVANALDDTYFFLPYIRNIIFPETVLLTGSSGSDYAAWINQIKNLYRNGLDACCSKLARNSVLRLTYRPLYRAEFRDFTVVHRDASQGIKAILDWIDAVLFPTGVGFLLLKLRLAEEHRLSKVIDLNRYLRLVHKPYITWQPQLIRFAKFKTELSTRDLLDSVLYGIANSFDPLEFNPDAFVETLKRNENQRYTESEAGQIYGERCHLLSFACLTGAESTTSATTGAFADESDRLLYEFATCTRLGDSINEPEWRPSPAQVKILTNENHISLWDSWRGMSLKESAVFLGTQDIHFNRQVLAHNIENDYLPLYLYALHQKYQLYVFSNDLMRKGANTDRNLREMRVLTARFINFRNQYWFNEVTRKPIGDVLYKKFQIGLGMTDLYDLVNSEVSDLQQYYEERRNQRIASALNILTFFFVPLSAVISFFGMNWVDGATWTLKHFAWSCLGMVALSTLSYGVYSLWHRLWRK